VGDGLSFATIGKVIDVMSTNDFWNDPTNQRRLLARLPEYRLSKFQRALPECYAVEMIRDYLLDIPGVVEWMQTKGR
jgi:ATP-dependent helicase Lhr and Lhr-like helicase